MHGTRRRTAKNLGTPSPAIHTAVAFCVDMYANKTQEQLSIQFVSIISRVEILLNIIGWDKFPYFAYWVGCDTPHTPQ